MLRNRARLVVSALAANTSPEYAGREVWVRQNESELVISDEELVLATHQLAKRPYEGKVVRDHFEGMRPARTTSAAESATGYRKKPTARLPVL